MTSILFVPGTGVRQPKYNQSFEQVAHWLEKLQPGVTLLPCYWGGSAGAALHQSGSSIPAYDTTRAISEEAAADTETTLWGLLYQDPYYELRSLASQRVERAAFVPGQPQSWESLNTRVRRLAAQPGLKPRLREAGISEVFSEAVQAITQSEPYSDALRTMAENQSMYRVAIARALIAKAMERYEDSEVEAQVLTDADLRDSLVTMLVEELGGTDRGIAGWAGKQLAGLALQAGTSVAKRKRGATTDATWPTAGDILRYQARGEALRAFIRDRIKEAQPPVVVLSHSLGGIASVDLLVLEQLTEVELLITVGSQAPFLYELDALYSLPFGAPLPDHFPPWLNIYDLRDFLSYVGESVFADRVEDVRVDNRQPFPRAHSAYWTNHETWEAVATRVSRMG